MLKGYNSYLRFWRRLWNRPWSHVHLWIGVWGSREDPESSNWKEFINVVESLEEKGEG